MLITLFYFSGCFVNVWVIFGFIWEEIVFLKGLVKLGKLREIRNFGDLKISGRTPRQSPTNLVCSCVGMNCFVVF